MNYLLAMLATALFCVACAHQGGGAASGPATPSNASGIQFYGTLDSGVTVHD